MRKLCPEEYRKEWKKNSLKLTKELHPIMKMFSYTDEEIKDALILIKRELSFQSITDIHSITITAKAENVLVRSINAQSTLDEQVLTLYLYHVHFNFFKVLREHSNMTVPEMADMLHVSIATYLNWEKENYIPEKWIQQLILEKTKLVTFQKKK